MGPIVLLVETCQYRFEQIRDDQKRSSLDYCPLTQLEALSRFIEHPTRDLKPIPADM